MKSKSKRLMGKGALVLGLASAMTLAGLSTAQAVEDEGAIARGGNLYDKWYKVLDVDKPKETHPLYPKAGKKAKDSWRCKECHGWDYLGKDGAYGKGSHYTGIKGINGAANKPVAKIVTVLKNPKHGYGDKMDDADLKDLALFVSKGQVNMDTYIDRATKRVKGDAAHGKQVFDTICAKCHGPKGLEPDDMGEVVGEVANDNPWETMNKILNGQPGESMPALRAISRKDVVDVLTYSQTLPTKR